MSAANGEGWPVERPRALTSTCLWCLRARDPGLDEDHELGHRPEHARQTREAHQAEDPVEEPGSGAFPDSEARTLEPGPSPNRAKRQVSIRVVRFLN